MIGGPRPASQRPSSGGGELVALGLGALLVLPSLCCYVAGGVGALIVHGRFATAPPPVVLTLAFAITRHPHDPALAWPAVTRHLVPGAAVVYPICIACFVAVGACVVMTVRRLTRGRRRRGFASAREVKASLSVAAVRQRAPQVRPGLGARRAQPFEVGLHLGREVATRTPLWASLEDSFLVLGPPRSGKGVSLIIPGVLDAPGAAIVTSTRAEVLMHTGVARREPVEVFDPQNECRWPTRLRWSPVAGCENPLTAINRARGFVAGAGFDEKTTTNADFWATSAAAVIRCYLHAAALGDRSISDVVAWAGRPGDAEPIRILRGSHDAAPGWADELVSNTTLDPRERDGIWSGVRRAFDCFADPRVLDACSPSSSHAFDGDRFLAERGTLYIVGSTRSQLSVAPLIAAMIEDLAERALTIAAGSRHGRLDPPLTLFLDEAANIAPLDSLPSLLSAGGGSGICTLVVLQSLAQARARWGQDRADAIWDASTVRVVFGGLGHADDLMRISRLAGEIDEEVGSASRGAGGPSWSTSIRQRPVLPPERLRTLEVGRALVLHRRTPPVEVVLDPWFERPCAGRVTAALEEAARRCGGLDAEDLDEDDPAALGTVP